MRARLPGAAAAAAGGEGSGGSVGRRNRGEKKTATAAPVFFRQRALSTGPHRHPSIPIHTQQAYSPTLGVAIGVFVTPTARRGDTTTARSTGSGAARENGERTAEVMAARAQTVVRRLARFIEKRRREGRTGKQTAEL